MSAPDCPRRLTAEQDTCALAGCRPCRAQRQDDKMATFAPPPGWERRMIEGRFCLVRAEARPPVKPATLDALREACPETKLGGES